MSLGQAAQTLPVRQMSTICIVFRVGGHQIQKFYMVTSQNNQSNFRVVMLVCQQGHDFLRRPTRQTERFR